MDSIQNVPENSSNNRGAGLFAYHCETQILEFVVFHNVPDARGGFIGVASEGEPGINLFSLGQPSSPIYGSIQLNSEEEVLLYSRQLYTSIVSVEFPAGEIRGQITVDFDWWAYLSGTNVVSPVTTPAVGVATMRLLGQQNRRVDYSIFHSIELPLRATMNIAREGENGPLDLVFPSVFSPIRGDDLVLDDDELEAFVTEGAYISITSIDNPFLGEVRGQIRRVNPCKASRDNTLTVSVSNNNNNNNDDDNKNASASYFVDIYTSSTGNDVINNQDTNAFFTQGENASGSASLCVLNFLFFITLLCWF